MRFVCGIDEMFAYILLAGLLGFSLPGTGHASWEEEWSRVLEAAKKEGKVVVSIPASAELRKKMEEVFEKRFAGIDLEVITAAGSKSVRRIADEFKAGVRYHDAHVGGTSSMVTGLIREKIAEPIEPSMMLPEVKEPKNWWGGHIYVDKAKRFAYAFQAYMSDNFYYNAKVVDPKELKSFDDLLNPKWKGKIGFLDPRAPGAGDSSWSYMWEVKGEDYLQKLVQQDILWLRDQRLLAQSLATGKVAITIGLTYYSFQPFIEAGLPVDALPNFKEGTYISGGSGNLVVIKDPPHPNATKVFLNWLLSREGQEVFSHAMGQATRRLDVDTSWLRRYGIVPAKDAFRPEDYSKYENQSEEKILRVRIPATRVAMKLLK